VIAVRTDFDPEEPIREADDEAVSAVVLKPPEQQAICPRPQEPQQKSRARSYFDEFGASRSTLELALLRRPKRLSTWISLPGNLTVGLEAASDAAQSWARGVRTEGNALHACMTRTIESIHR
jgi:antitoxin component HigA of HigAB toxin-antitoxin module